MKNNLISKIISWIYLAGFVIILTLPALNLPPYFFPPDFAKTIIFRSILAVLLTLFIYQLLYQQPSPNLHSIKKNPLTWALAAVFITFLLSTIFAVDPYLSLWGNPIRGGGFITFASYIIFGVLAFLLLTKDDWERIWNLSIGVGGLVSLIAIMQYFHIFRSIFLPVEGRPASTMGNPILLAIYLLLLCFITLSKGIEEKERWKKNYYFGALALFSVAIFITESRAAYLGILVGLIYFLIWYPSQKLHLAKIVSFGLIILALASVICMALFTSLLPRFSIKNLTTDSRFDAFPIEFSMVKAHPLTGYGMENFSVGFDKYYNPTNSSLIGIIAWWDRAHNIVFQILSDAGVLGLLAYIFLFGTLFWQLYKMKNPTSHAIIASFIAYIIANLFSFDAFGSYLILFLLIGYSLHLAAPDKSIARSDLTISHGGTGKLIIMILLSGGIIFFCWQYNVRPFFINAQINKNAILVANKYCGEVLYDMDNLLKKQSFLDAYARLKYVEFTKVCNEFFPENNTAYLIKDLQVIGEATKIQPLYVRYWIGMATFGNDLAKKEKDVKIKNDLLENVNKHLDEALKLAPKHPEILIQQARNQMMAGNYQVMKDYSEKCIAFNQDLGDCYFYLSIAKIYLKDTDGAKEDFILANKKTAITHSEEGLNTLADAYASIPDYQNLSIIFRELVSIKPNSAQYHSSLAFFYSKLEKYKEARQEALEVLKLSPESKPNVDAFLKTLPN